MAFVIGMNYSASVHRSPVGWASEIDDSTGRDDYTPWNDPSDDLADDNVVETDYDPASITVQMSIWQELCASHPADERQVNINISNRLVTRNWPSVSLLFDESVDKKRKHSIGFRD